MLSWQPGPVKLLRKQQHAAQSAHRQGKTVLKLARPAFVVHIADTLVIYLCR